MSLFRLLVTAGCWTAAFFCLHAFAQATRADDQPGFYSNYASTYHDRLAAMDVSLAKLGFVGEASALWPEVALRFTLSQPGVHTAIVGTTDAAHVAANIAAAEKGPLAEEQVAALRAAFADAERASADEWLAQG